MYNSWIQTVKATAATQGVVDPFKPEYIPNTAGQRAIFDEENAYVFLIAASTVKYPSGRAIIAKYAAKNDGQTIFKELEADATAIEVKHQNERILESKLREMDASPDKWNRSLEDFLDTWTRNLINLEETREKSVPDEDKQKWLSSSLYENPTARQAINQARLLQNATGGTPQSFDNWMRYLRISFQQEDHSKISNDFRTKQRNTRQNRQLATNAAKYNNNNSNNGKSKAYKGQRLTKEERKQRIKELGLWIDPEVFNKQWTSEQRGEHIAKIKRVLHSSAYPGLDQSRSSTNQRLQSSVADCGNSVLTEPTMQSHQSIPGTPTTAGNYPHSFNGYTTKISTLKPHTEYRADSHFSNQIQPTQSTQSTQRAQFQFDHGDPIPGSMASALSTPLQQAQPQGGEPSPSVIRFNNRTYLAAKSIQVHQNSNSNSTLNQVGDLLDGGCNGGIAGDNLLILNKDPFQKIDSIGIEQNQLKDLPIVQAAGLLQTAKGPIVCIFNEYAGHARGQTIHSLCQLRDTMGFLLMKWPDNICESMARQALNPWPFHTVEQLSKLICYSTKG